MTRILILFALLLSRSGYAQQPDSVDARLFLPIHQPNLLPKDAPLIVHFVGFDKSQKRVSYKVTAVPVAQNIYRFPLDSFFYHRLIFEIGGYSCSMVCINNLQGKAGSVTSFDILLEERKFDPQLLKMFPPCMLKEEE
jgi:hypothetical protein